MRKSVFVTGAAMGIGKAVAAHYADKGWHVGITDVDEPALESFRKEYGGKIAYSAVMDVRDEKRTAEVIADFAQAAGGKIDLFINNAGVAWMEPFEAQPLSNHHAILDVNNRGMLNCAYHAFPYLKDARGTLVNLCSQAANYGVPTETTYSASKFFVRGFTEALSIEWQKYGIYVCAIWPNFVDTPMMEKCSSIVSRRVGINLTTRDVVKMISIAVGLNMKFLVHWHVDTLFWRFLMAAGVKQPQFITRYIYKKIAGY
ncbi:MAG TPA: SDR family NAD(P)-dependent oxidoreductase [Deltaproteobacteria bacterium]|nr:SDR family NAD(P)-dependent oxidoreductase [Deltaproteobacteria bacterium]HPR55883.1 SDR family NAD(P)-dependent oxidoreductase [Deltaproteobacteria bacterium]HXK47664.1 SDR family NAD(P)-dependent oxidoreductase [Deltaproteobacteria bacterium]